ncbi:MAG: hypothetical protein MR823_06880 [Ruminococcus sp.]|nr:hypothetical protein [Ruminococcus sp.]MDY4908984.1 hypothetical protein [Candidatus Fimenecus sp.]
MLKMKKILSVALVVFMLLSTVAIGAYAVPANDAEVGLVLVSDKKESEIVPGAKVTVTFYFEMKDYDQLMSDTKFAILYDANVYTPDTTSRTFLGDWANYAKDATTAKINASFGTTVMNASSMTAEEKAKYNNAVMLTAGADSGLGATSKAGYSVTKGENGLSVAQCSIVFNVTGDAAAVAAGNKNIKICDTLNTTQYIKSTTGSTTPKNVASIDTSKGNIMANMPTAPAGPAVTKAKSQVKMTATSATTVADEFSFRVISKISDSDWDTYFKNTGVDGAKTDYITAVGMVAYKGAAAFDAETAKSVVAGALVADYAAAKTDYISKVSDTADAEFGAIIKANHSKLGNDVTYMGFVQYVDASGNAQTIFYETAETAALSTNYNTIVRDYLARYPFAA